MGILGIGVDVLHVPRIASLLKTYPKRLPSRILSCDEFAEYKGADPTFIAVRWAVKEAAYKALYPHFRASWKDFTYTSMKNGHKPRLLFRPQSSQDTSVVGGIHVSISHDGDYVFASVLVERAQ